MQESLALLRNSLHSLLVHTLQTLEETGRTVCDVTNTGHWENTMDLARQVWKKSRHIDIFIKLLERVEGHSGVYLETAAGTTSAGPASETLAQLIELAQTMGDVDIERVLEFVLAETHTRVCKDQANAIA